MSFPLHRNGFIPFPFGEVADENNAVHGIDETIVIEVAGGVDFADITAHVTNGIKSIGIYVIRGGAGEVASRGVAFAVAGIVEGMFVSGSIVNATIVVPGSIG